MRRPTFLLLALSFPALLPAQILAAPSGRDSVITLSTSRSTRVAPDRASLFVTIEGVAESTNDALARAEAKRDAVVRALQALGPAIELSTPVPYAVGPTPNQRGFPSAQSNTMTAKIAFRVNVKQIDRLARVLAVANDAGATATGPVIYESSATDSLRRVEADAAIAGLRRDADALAKSLGGRIVSLLDVSATNPDRLFPQLNMLPNESFGQQIMAPEVQVTVNLTVRFKLSR
jgi:uncharacterized protein